MDWSNLSYILILALAAILSGVLAFAAWKRQVLVGKLFLISILLATAWWLVGVAFHIGSLETSWRLFWTKTQYLSIAILPTLWLLYTLQYSGFNRILIRRILILLAIEPVFSIFLAWTSGEHFLLWSQEALAVGITTSLWQPLGPWGWLHFIYSTLINLISTIVLVRAFVHLHYLDRSQTLAAISGVLLVTLGIGMEVMHLNPFLPLPSAAIILTLAAFLVALAMIRIRLMDIVPLARDTVIENMSDAVLVLDNSNHIADLNQAAHELLNLGAVNPHGMTIEKAWSAWPSEMTLPVGKVEVVKEVTLVRGEKTRTYDMRISSLTDQRNILSGRLVVLRDITRQKRSEEALRRRDDILDAIGFVAEQFMRRIPLEDALPEVFARLGGASRVSRVYLLENRYEPDGSMTCVYRYEWTAWGIPPTINDEKLRTLSLQDSGIGRWVNILGQGKVIHDQLPNLPASEQLFLQGRDVRSLVVVPIFMDLEWWGSLGFEDCKTERDWNSVEIELLRTAANTIGGALQRLQSDEAVRHWAEVIQTLLSLSETIGSTMEIQQVLNQVIQAAHTLLPVERVSILLWDDAKNTLLPTMPESGGFAGLIPPEGNSQELSALGLTPQEIPLIGELQQHKKAVTIRNTKNHPLFPPEISQKYNITSLMAVPITFHDRFIGVLYVDYTQKEHIFSLQEIDLATALARQAGLAIERARLYTMSQEDAEELAALYRASSKLLTTGYDLNAMAHLITEVVTGEFDFSYCSLLWVEPENNRLRVIAQQGFMDLQELPLNLDGPGLTIEAARTGEVIYAPDVTKNPLYLVASQHTRSEIAIPLKVGQDVIAVLNLESPEVDAFDERSRRILTAFTDDAALALLNVRLFNAANIHARQVALLNEITHIALQKTELHTMLGRLAGRMIELIHSDQCYITLWDAEHQQVIPGGASGELNKIYSVWSPSPGEPSLTAAVLSAGQPIAVNDIDHSEHLLPSATQRFPSHSLLGLPMVVGEQKLGAVLIGFSEPHNFTQREISICQQAADQVSLAIAEAWSLEVARQRAEEAETLRQAGAVVTSTLKEEESIQSIIQQLERVVPYDSASVQMLGDGYLEIVGGIGWDDISRVIGLRFPVPGDNPNTRVVEQRQPFILGEAANEFPSFREPPHAHIHSWMGVPLLLHDQVTGIIAMDSTKPNYFTPDHARLATAFADQVAIVIENARLYKEARQAAERRTILHQVSQEIVTASFEPEEIYSAIFNAAKQLMPTEAFAITLVSSDRPHAEAVFLIDKNGRAPNQQFLKNQGLTGRVLEAGKAIYIPDLENSPELAGLHFGGKENTRSILALPLRVGDRIIGMLSAQSYHPNAYTSEDRYLLEMLAATAAIAIENTRLLKEIQWLAITDPLTGLYNRRGLFELAEREVDRFRRFDRPFCAFMIDLDLFKDVNDTYGHAIGDQVLVGLADGLKANIRDMDIIGRYGGEEIVVVLPETSLELALEAAERLRKYVEEHPFPTDRGEIGVTISVGVAEIKEHIPDLATLIDRADSAMYQAKQSGRNRVRGYEDPSIIPPPQAGKVRPKKA